MATAVHTSQRPAEVEDLQQQARDFLIPEFSSPWPHTLHPAVEEARKAANEWASYHFPALAGSKRFSKNMESNVIDILAAGFYSTGPLWGLEFGMEMIFFYYVLDDEVGHTGKALTSSSGVHAAQLGVAQIFLELLLVRMSSFPREEALEKLLQGILAVDEKWGLKKRDRIETFLSQAERHPGTVEYSSESDEVGASPMTSAFRNLWKRATSVMPEDWSLRFACIFQRDMVGMLMEAHEQNLGIAPNSISECIQQRREYACVESSLVIGELANNIHISSTNYYSPPMQRLVQAINDVVAWHNDIHSFRKEFLAGEENNLVHVTSKMVGCSYNRAAEIVNSMVVHRCKDMNLAATELIHNYADSEGEESFLDRESAEKYILMCTDFVDATHDFHQRSSRFHEKR